jgi:hypothetical protein
MFFDGSQQMVTNTDARIEKEKCYTFYFCISAFWNCLQQNNTRSLLPYMYSLRNVIQNVPITVYLLCYIDHCNIITG